jgi:3-hydroxyisobutyrate dehydrogenase
MMHVGIVGLGNMGSAIAQNLLARGYTVSVWNRTPHKADALVAKGATESSSIRALVESADAVIVMLWGDETAREISLSQVIPAARSRQLVIEMSTLSPSMYEVLEKAATDRAIEFLAAPVLGSLSFAQQGTLTVLPGGQQTTFERARPLLESIGSTIIYTGSARASGHLKLANNTILAIFAEALGELLPFCERGGVERGIAVESLTGAFQRSAATKKEQLLNVDSQTRFSLDALLKDLHLAESSAVPLQLSIPLLHTVLPAMQQLAERGFGDRDYIALALEEEREMVTGST